MDREIKFRAWDKRTEMGKPGSMSYNQDFCFSQIRHPDGLIIMQYTGLKDREGKEIYEGDIIICEGVYQPCSTKLEGPEPYRDIGDVKWSDIYLGWFFMGDSLADLDPNECKIIGDIHTTPELLEGKT